MGACSACGPCQVGEFDNSLESQQKATLAETLRVETSQPNTFRRCRSVLLMEDAKMGRDNVLYDAVEEFTDNDLNQIKKTLRKHFIFAQIPEEELSCFSGKMRPCKAKAGTDIFREGDLSGTYFIILDGKCQIQINKVPRKIIAFGESFGDLGIIYNAPRSATVHALTDCYLAAMDRVCFKLLMDRLHLAAKSQQRSFLQVLSFFKELTNEQQNAITEICLTQNYQEGQTIFMKGDAANSLYILKEGIAQNQEKGTELRRMDYFGEQAIMVEHCLRSYTLVAKTRCSMISASKENIKTSLGDSLKNTLIKNMVLKMVTDSELRRNFNWKQAVLLAQTEEFKKNDVIFQRGETVRGQVCVLLYSQLMGNSTIYEQRAIVQLSQLIKQGYFKCSEEMRAISHGCLVRILINLDSMQLTVNPCSTNGQNSIRSIGTGKKSIDLKMRLDDFYMIRKLQQGNFGKVYACWNTKKQRMYAMKVMDRRNIENQEVFQYVMNEDAILRSVPAHSFLVNYHRLIKKSHLLCFVMDLVEGEDLFDAITRVKIFSPENARFLVSQILLVIQHLHSCRVIYRDLKPENVIISCEGYIKLVDLGVAKKLKTGKSLRTTTIIGTPHYMAPEVITSMGYTFTVDLWAIGIITYELLCGKLPFGNDSDDPFFIYSEIMNAVVKYPRSCPKHCKSLIETLLSREPQQRLGHGYEQLRKHPFFNGNNWTRLLRKEQISSLKINYDKIEQCEISKQVTNQKYKLPHYFLQEMPL